MNKNARLRSTLGNCQINQQPGAPEDNTSIPAWCRWPPSKTIQRSKLTRHVPSAANPATPIKGDEPATDDADVYVPEAFCKQEHFRATCPKWSLVTSRHRPWVMRATAQPWLWTEASCLGLYAYNCSGCFLTAPRGTYETSTDRGFGIK